MPISSSDFVSFAESIDCTSGEAAIRGAINRAYYGAYHHCDSWHKKLPCPGHNIGHSGGIHQTLINQLTNPDNSVGSATGLRSRGVGYALRDLKAIRTCADYDLTAAHALEDSENACAKARAILSRI